MILDLKIYFFGSIRGGREDVKLYSQLIDYLNTKGKVLTEHIGDKNLVVWGEDKLSDRAIHDRDLNWILESDVFIGEATKPSLGVGYELGKGTDLGKPILALYRPQEGRRLSAMISGSPGIKVVEYKTLEDAKSYVDKFLEEPEVIRRVMENRLKKIT